MNLRSRVAPSTPATMLLSAAMAVALVLASAGPLAAQDGPEADFVPVTDAMLQSPADGDWLMWRRTLDGWGFRRGLLANY